MPIYEFYCEECNVIFNFFSPRVNTSKIPDCPKCGKEELSKQVSLFATVGKAKDDEDDQFSGLDETKMEQAFESLVGEAEKINEDDPKQMAALMRKFTAKSGISLGDSMEEAISRMEAGEDPDQVEKDMGDLLNEDDFSLKKTGIAKLKRKPPSYDETLYEL